MIDINKKYRTRAGAEVRFYAVDGKDPRPVHGAFKNETGWVSCCWQRDGVQMFHEGAYDLIEVKPRIQRTVWFNVYLHSSSTGRHYANKKYADQNAAFNRLACVKVEIDCEEGEGL